MSPDEPIPRNRERISESDEKKLSDIDARLRAPIYESFKVYTANKVRTKTEVHLGVSGEKVEIFPVVQQRISAKFFGRHKASTHDMDSVVACNLTDTKSNSRASFRLVYDQTTAAAASLDSSLSPCFKHHEFEAPSDVANTIVQKINHILELRPSASRLEKYLAIRDKKCHRKNSFLVGPR